MVSEHRRGYCQKYYQNYRKNHKKRIKEIYSKYDRTHKEKRNKHYREKWKNDEKFRERKFAYFNKLKEQGRMKILKRRGWILHKHRWNKMHISRKVIHRANTIIKEMELIEITGATDLKYWNQIKLRLDACKVLSESWYEEYKLLQGK